MLADKFKFFFVKGLEEISKAQAKHAQSTCTWFGASMAELLLYYKF